MIHVCSLARLHETVEDTGARHVVSLLGDEFRVERPRGIAAEKSSLAAAARHFVPARRLRLAGRGARRGSSTIRARLGPPRATGCALLCRHQPLDRKRLCQRLRAQSEIATKRALRGRCAAPRLPPRRTSASYRLPTACSVATAAWLPRSKRSAAELQPKKRCRSASTLNDALWRRAHGRHGRSRPMHRLARSQRRAWVALVEIAIGEAQT